jgi:hypothetical protein
MLVSSHLLQSAMATLTYAGFAVYLTWPLALDLDTRIYGAVGDLTGAIATYRELVEAGQFPFAPGTLTDFSAPDGLDIRWTLNILTWPATGALYVLTALFGSIAAVGIYTLLGFTLTGLATFLFVRRIVKHSGVAFVAGLAYAFYPFVVVKAQGHLEYVHGWVLILPAWRLYELVEKPTATNGLWAGGALLFAFAWTPYHILFAGVMAIGFAAAGLLFARQRRLLRPMISAFAIAGSVAAVWVVAMAILDRAAPYSEVRTHTIEEAVAYSARAAEYVVPTSEHPLFGDQAGQYRASHLHGSNYSENTLYIGISVLLLASIGLIAAARRPGPGRRIAVTAAIVAVLGFAFSAPPHVELMGISVPTPTEYVFEATTTWRVFSRFVVVVMLGLVILAALGMHALVRRRPKALQGALLAAFAVVVMADLWATRAAEGTNKINVPPTYGQLAKMPRGVAVEYPLVRAEESIYGDIFYQGWHDNPIVNGYRAGSPEENRALRLRRLPDPRTARGLKALGVRYVLVRQDLEAAGLPDPGRPERHFRLVTRDPYIALYELRVPGIASLITPMEGFAPFERAATGRFQWLTRNEGNIELRGSCDPCAGTVAMTVRTFAQPRNVVVMGPGGTALTRARVATGRRLRFHVRFSGKMILKMRADPGPQSIGGAVGSKDTRSVSVAVSRESFIPDRNERRR